MRVNQQIPDLFDDHGFLTDPDLWDRDLALGIAHQLDIGEFQDTHWAVVDYLREYFLANASLPREEEVCRELDLVGDCVRRLFGGPIEAWKVAGLPNPGEEKRKHLFEG